MRVVLDANVIISAAIRPDGVPGKVLSAAFDTQYQLVISPAIVAEVEGALSLRKIRKYLRSAEEAQRWLRGVVVNAVIVPDVPHSVGLSRDPSDDAVLAAALEGQAGVIVTGDADLLVLEEFQGISIVTPRTFIDVLPSLPR